MPLLRPHRLGLALVALLASAWLLPRMPSPPGLVAALQETAPTPPVLPAWDRLDLGLPQGDVHAPVDLAMDPESGDLYVLGYRTREGPPALAVLDGKTGALVRRVPLPFEPTSGQILFPPEGGQALLLAWNEARVYRYDPDGDRLTRWMEGVWALQLSPDGRTVALVFSDRIGLYDLATETLLWEMEATPGSELALSDRALLTLERLPQGQRLRVWAKDGGRLLAEALLPADRVQVWALGRGPDDTWLLLVSQDDTIRLERRSASLELLATGPGLWDSRILYDESQDRVLLAGRRPDPIPPQRSPYALRALDSTSLEVRAERDWPDAAYPTHMALLPDRIGAIHAFDAGDQVVFLDRATLDIRGRTALGIRLLGSVLAVDPAWLFVADNQQRIWRVDRASGEAAVLGMGTWPMAAAPDGGRLYANRWQQGRLQVVALDPGSGRTLAAFPQGGAIAPDPTGDRIYLVERGITAYDGAGNLLGRLESTFPSGEPVPGLGPYARNAWVNPTTGGLVVLMNNGIPGTNNANQLRLYPPPAQSTDLPPDTPIEIVPDPGNALDTVAFDPQTGRLFAAFQDLRGQSAVLRVEGDGSQPRLLHGRSGRLFLDERSRNLYVEGDGTFARLGLDLRPRLFYAGPDEMAGPVLAAQERRLYFRVEGRPVLGHVALTQLRPIWPRVGPPQDRLPGRGVLRFTAGTLADGAVGLLVHTGGPEGGLFLSVDDGATWRPLALTHPLDISLYVTTAIGPDGTLFFSGSGPFGGEGVLRSRDGGRTWQRLLKGLPDLRAQRFVLPPAGQARPPGRIPVYMTTPTRRLLALDEATRTWRPVSIPEEVSWVLSSLWVADDGSLFAGAHRSLDQGATWERFLAPDAAIDLELVDAAFHRTRRLYGWQRDGERLRFVRSDDGGDTWRPTEPGLIFGREHAFHLSLHQAGEWLYVVDRDVEGIHRLFRSQDGGNTWESALPNLADANLPRFTPDGRLWFLQSTDENPSLRWLALQALDWTPAEPDIAPAAAPAGQITPAPERAEEAAAGCPEPRGEAALLARQLPELGCPLEKGRSVFMASQPFQRGRMLWRSDTRTIYVLFQDGTWQAFADTWQEGQPTQDPTLVPPAGLYQPIRGFGRLWREELGGPDAAIGWATAPESGRSGRVQRWTRGLLLGFGLADRVVLLADGRWRALGP